MAANDVFIPVSERGWRRGFQNLLRVENGKWFRTRTWWVMGLIWILVINGILAGLLWSSEVTDPANAVGLFGMFMGLFPNIAVIIIMQDAIVGEKESGTAAWVMSKPASRTAFVVSKWIGNSIGVLVSMVFMPALVAYIQISIAAGGPLDVIPFLGGLAVIYLNMMFYLTLTLMLGVFFDHRGPVIGIPLAFAFGQQLILGLFPFLQNILPWILTVPVGENQMTVAGAVMQGQPPTSLVPVYFALGMTILFIALGVWRFEKEEF